MEKLITKANGAVEKARKLALHHHRVLAQNNELENDVKTLREALEAEHQKNAELNNKIKIIKLAQNIGSERPEENPEITELKRKINEYIREIDNCIAMLNE